MKKAILSPLSSAFVIPGLGQIINRHLKKGVCILAGTFVLFIAALIKFYQILSAALEAENMNPSDESFGLRINHGQAHGRRFFWLMVSARSVCRTLDLFSSGCTSDRQEN
ncbi:MAG: hypothetical protein JRF53_13570 [Deltaproteobacteria bacterium]|nr:hypothetical protein [Deltaproteobacteria bacterium]